jgi:hypothetical protein
VLCAVTEQVAHFELTQYPLDGRGDAELGFEGCLMFDRRGGFTLKGLDTDTTKEAWLLRHRTMGGPQLLERNAKPVTAIDVDGNGSDDDDDDENPDAPSTLNATSPIPSFRSDRRILRLLIARHFADVLQHAYLKDQEEHEGEEEAPVVG